MQKNEKREAKLRLRVSDAENRIFNVKSASGRSIGHAAGGRGDGPGLVVAGAGNEADLVFQRVLDLPGLGALNGRLVLLNLDRFDHPGDLAELDRLASSVRPVTDTLFLSAIALDGFGQGATRTDALFDALLGFCAQHGLNLRGHRPANHIIRDYAS